MLNDDYVIVGLMMSVMFFILGLIFAIMKERGSGLIAGFNFKSKEERNMMKNNWF